MSEVIPKILCKESTTHRKKSNFRYYSGTILETTLTNQSDTLCQVKTLEAKYKDIVAITSVGFPTPDTITVLNGDKVRIVPSESLKETIHGKIIKIEDLNETINHHGKKSIHLAVENNNTKAVESILSGQGKKNVNAIDDSGWTSLHYAAQNGNLDMVKLLIKNGAEFKAMDKDGRAPIHIAAFYGRTNIVEFFIDSKIPIDWKSDKSGITPLHWAAEGGHLNASRFLVAQGANINAKDNSGQTVLHHAVKGRSLEVVEYVSPLVDNVNVKENKNYETPLHYAVKETPVQIPYINGKLSFNLNIIRHLIERHKDIDINAKDRNNQNTPLHYAVENNDYNIAGYLSQQLRQRGIDPDSIKIFMAKHL